MNPLRPYAQRILKWRGDSTAKRRLLIVVFIPVLFALLPLRAARDEARRLVELARDNW